MIKLRKEFADRIRSLGELTPEQRKKLLAGLNQMKSGFDFEEKVKEAIDSTDIEADKAAEITSAVIGLHYLYANSPESNLRKFIGELLDAISEALPDKDISKSISNEVLTDYLNAASLRTSAKAATLLFDEERVFLNARIITDIRPVFGEDASSSDIPAAFIIHSLRVSYRGEGGEDFFIGLSTKDLEEFKKVIERALIKANTLNQLLPKLTKEPIFPK